MIATLKLQFAKTITLGSSISKGLEMHLQPLLLPTMKSLLPRRYRKWAELALSLSFKSIAISIAWSIRRVISSYHSAIRGGLLCSKNILQYLRCMGYLSNNSSSSDSGSGGGDSKHDDGSSSSNSSRKQLASMLYYRSSSFWATCWQCVASYSNCPLGSRYPSH